MVRWLLVGVGDIARKRVIPAILAEPRSELYGVCTRDVSKAEAYSGVRAWTSLEDALQDANIDAVYIASPVALHAPQTIACLKAGKPVLCEKPVAMDFKQAETMLAAQRESGLLLGVSYYRRLYPKLLRAKELIAEGAIGQVVMAEANCHGWLESEERGWLRDPALSGGGPLYDIGSHRIDAMNFLLGRPIRATGMLSNAVHDMKVEDSATTLIEYASGVHGVVDVRWNSRVPRDQFRIIGTEGELNLDPLGGPSLQFAGREEWLPTHANVHYPLVENFVAAVLDGAALDGAVLACPVEEAVWTDWVTSEVMRQARA